MSCGQCSHKYYFAEGIFCFCCIFLNLCVVLLCFSFDTPMVYPCNQWMSRSRVRCFKQVRVFRGPQNAEGVPISLVKWGWGGPHITRDMGTGVPISRGSPYRAYTGPNMMAMSRKFWSGRKIGPGDQNFGPGGPFFPENFGPPVKISVRPA